MEASYCRSWKHNVMSSLPHFTKMSSELSACGLGDTTHGQSERTEPRIFHQRESGASCRECTSYVSLVGTLNSTFTRHQHYLTISHLSIGPINIFPPVGPSQTGSTILFSFSPTMDTITLLTPTRAQNTQQTRRQPTSQVPKTITRFDEAQVIYAGLYNLFFDILDPPRNMHMCPPSRP